MKKYLGSLPLVAIVAMAGCNIFGPPAADPAAVLAGTWQAVFDEPGDLEGFDIQVTFDSAGKVTQITATPPDGGTATLDVSDSTTTELEGDQVTVTIPSAGGERIYSGTLSEDQNTIDGALSQSLDFPSGNVTLPGGDLTLTRVADAG